MADVDPRIVALKAEAAETVSPRQREIIKLLLRQSTGKAKSPKKPK